MDYGKEIKRIIDSGKEDEFFEELANREAKSPKIREKVIAPFIGDAFTEVAAGNIELGGSYIEKGFEGDEGLTNKVFNSVLRKI